MSKKKWTNSWDYTCVVRKDFRDDHGGGPEEMPHRKKRSGKKKCKRSKDGLHDFTKKVPRMVTEVTYSRSTKKRTSAQVERHYVVCSKCGKPKDFYWGTFVWREVW